MNERFRRDTTQASRNTALQRALDRATRRQDDARKGIVPELGDPSAIRLLAGKVRDQALDRLDERLAALTEKIRAAGGQIHFALDAEQARRIVADIARRERCRLAIKTKSMMCEEIELNPYLEARGLEVVETDLGEYIIQLAGEPPSHIIGPACHKTAKDIAALFHEKLGVPYTEDAETLARSARKILREKFRQADMGITGANFAVAQTGSVVLVTNEGNGRFVSSRPRVLVSVMGMEKVIDGMPDLAVLLKVLARCATGQRMSVFTNLTSGPRHADDPDGPQQYHLVIVDNGRSRVLGSKYRQLLRCIRCGACLNACPVYRKLGGHAYASVYPGPIGKLLTPLLETLHDRADFPQMSALCDACRDACPVRIELPEMLILMRKDLIELGEAPLSQRMAFAAWAKAMTTPSLYRWGWRLGQLALTWEGQRGWVERVPPAGNPWTDVRDLPVPAAKPFHRIWAESLRDERMPSRESSSALRERESDAAPTAHPHDDNRRPHVEVASADPWTPAPDAGAEAHASEPECPEDVFLDRVRRALRTVTPAEGRPDAEHARLVTETDDVLGRFRQRLAELKVVTHEASDKTDALDAVAEAVRRIGATTAVMADEGLIDCSGLADRLSKAGCPLTIVREGNGLGPSFESDVGITTGLLGIAETGSIAIDSGPPRRRLIGLAPPAHIILLPTSTVVPDLLDWAGWYESNPIQANHTLITGPSKTADIELNLVTGMHAPGVVHVVMIEDRG